jgi:hypothetical protein
MNRDKDQQNDNQQQSNHQRKQHSGTFRESSHSDEKSATNVKEEEAGLEQERKEAMTERD